MTAGPTEGRADRGGTAVVRHRDDRRTGSAHGGGNARSARRPEGRRDRCRPGDPQPRTRVVDGEARWLRQSGDTDWRRDRAGEAEPSAGQRTDAPKPPVYDPKTANRHVLQQHRPGVRRPPHVHGQLSWLQRLRHRGVEGPEGDRLDRLPGWAGRRVGLQEPAVHVRRAGARASRLRHAGARDRRLATNASAASASSTSPTSGSRARWPPSRAAAARTPTRWCPTRRIHRNVYVYGSGTGRRALGRRTLGLLGQGSERRPATRHCSASTSSRCRSRSRKTRRS